LSTDDLKSLINSLEEQLPEMSEEQIYDSASRIKLLLSSMEQCLSSAPVNSSSKKPSSKKYPRAILEELIAKNRDIVLLKRERNKRRKPSEFNDPSKKRTDEVNIVNKKLGARISPQHVQSFNRSSEVYETKRDSLETAVDLLELFSEIAIVSTEKNIRLDCLVDEELMKAAVDLVLTRITPNIDK